MKTHNDIILASSSPARLSLLNQIGIFPSEIFSPNVNEDTIPSESPSRYCERIAKSKVSYASIKYKDKIVLGADTVVCCGNRILSKAHSDKDIEYYLRILSGRRHRVITYVCLFSPKDDKFLVKNSISIVKLKRLTENEIRNYIDSKEGINKAAGCNLQGIAGKFVVWIRGSYTGCIGLPLYETSCLLSSVQIN